ncbi:hypothetical protein M758_UG063300 [Ceratodon purpureus]|nr:hypothetical protein M758_UG063300 [Ceratodon purpureus]
MHKFAVSRHSTEAMTLESLQITLGDVVPLVMHDCNAYTKEVELGYRYDPSLEPLSSAIVAIRASGNVLRISQIGK